MGELGISLVEGNRIASQDPSSIEVAEGKDSKITSPFVILPAGREREEGRKGGRERQKVRREGRSEEMPSARATEDDSNQAPRQDPHTCPHGRR